ncbi:MAG: PAS domain S-box protein [Vicinamibacterales bacterium]
MEARSPAGQLEPTRMLRAIVDHAESAIVAKDLRGVILAWNGAAERLFGWTAAEAIGQSIFMVIPEDRRHEEDEILARLKAGDVVRRFETVRRRRDGSLVHVELTITPVHGDDGQVSGAVKIAGDLTERRRVRAALQAEESRFRTLADHISQLAWMADPTGWIFWYNRRWFEFTGTTLDEMQGWGWRAVHHPDHVDRVVTRIQHSWDTGEPWEDTFPLRGRDGEYRWFLSRALPIRDDDGAIVRWFGTNTDITEQRRLEAALAASNRRKDDFLATLSHELRNPLGAIRTAVAAMRAADGAAAPVATALPIVERQLAHVSRLLDDLLDVSRITHDRLVLQRASADIGQVARDSAEALRPAFAAAGVDLEVTLPDAPVLAVVDAVRVQQIVGNLLSNAAKFTPAGGRARLEVRADPDTVTLTVSDTGVGIDADKRDEIFDLFAQASPGTHRVTGGLGIGLSLVRRLAELHGGAVDVHSDGPGRGTTFTVRLPRGAVAPAAVEAPARPADGSGRRVLIVDDDRDNAEALAMFLRLEGHEVSLAGSGEAALDAAAHAQPDVVLLDVGLPGIDGHETCRQLRALGSTSLVVAVTGWGQAEDRARTSAAGFDRHLVKPVDPVTVAELVRAAPAVP